VVGAEAQQVNRPILIAAIITTVFGLIIAACVAVEGCEPVCGSPFAVASS
jgi:hypothetical protein